MSRQQGGGNQAKKSEGGAPMNYGLFFCGQATFAEYYLLTMIKKGIDDLMSHVMSHVSCHVFCVVSCL